MSSSPQATPVALLITGEDAAHRIAALAAETYDGDEVAVALVDAGGGRWRVAIHFRTQPNQKALRALVAAAAGPAAAKALRLEVVEAADWVRDSLSRLKPVNAGRFIVHGVHDRINIPPNRIGIEIEAALAFGTGHHGTTHGCLLALDRLCKALNERGRVWRILDLGTGSGVLAIAAARALHRHVLATDIDISAVRVARANARPNRAGGMVEIVQADGVAAPRLRAQAPFDLILANILLGPLLRLAAPLRRLTAHGGRIVLSGIVPAQANAVIAAYRPFALERRLDLDGWTTLVFMRGARLSAGVARRVRGS
ncbi:MAG: 50S ribosomal protein L11 methyltransferase [Xanthobacteraceae bacterium]